MASNVASNEHFHLSQRECCLCQEPRVWSTGLPLILSWCVVMALRQTSPSGYRNPGGLLIIFIFFWQWPQLRMITMPRVPQVCVHSSGSYGHRNISGCTSPLVGGSLLQSLIAHCFCTIVPAPSLSTTAPSTGHFGCQGTWLSVDLKISHQLWRYNLWYLLWGKINHATFISTWGSHTCLLRVISKTPKAHSIYMRTRKSFSPF